ncbi:DUF2735 domain-containing protein [Hansschlegelia sp. KR7-227]|jgi:hypothetical protein|uniref:DUF2735 domain-containing protein n=1 Tax=Hansschlegelia sp. KR7-227 TaxID=3400914 RepID=UPI003BFC197D
MIMTSSRGSAKIYEFPARPRATSGGHRDGSGSAVVVGLPIQPKIVFGSGWYHEEAIREDAQRAGKH